MPARTKEIKRSKNMVIIDEETLDKAKVYQKLFWEVLKIFFFAAAFGYVEGSVAHYLRMHFFPQGFGPDLNSMRHENTLIVELGREAATMVMLFCVAAMTKGPFLRRFSVFVFAFAVWDLLYYVSLYAFEKWPASLMDWDVLFLIPAPWFAPVLAPVAISLLGIAGSLFALWIFARDGEFTAGAWPILLLIAGLLTYLSTFFHGIHIMRFPTHYHWDIFIAGTVLVAASYAILAAKNLRRV